MMNPKEWKIYTLHGFNVGDYGAKTTDVMANLLRIRGYYVEEIDREHENLIDARTEANEVVQRLSDKLSSQEYPLEKTIVIGHSHGGNLTHMTMEYRAKRSKKLPFASVLINPALERKAKFPPKTMTFCYHSMDDNVVLTSDWLDYLPWNAISKMLGGKGNPWGSAGKYGLTIDGPCNMWNVDLKKLYPGTIDHSDVFYNEELCNIVTTDILERIDALCL